MQVKINIWGRLVVYQEIAGLSCNVLTNFASKSKGSVKKLRSSSSSPQADLSHFSSPLRCPNQIPNLNHQTISSFGYSSYQDQVLTRQIAAASTKNPVTHKLQPTASRLQALKLQAPAAIASVRISSYEILCCRRILAVSSFKA